MCCHFFIGAATRNGDAMRRSLTERRRAGATGDDGFTLIELMIVVLIIAILIAIAIPTFLGARRRAENRAAQVSLRIALTVEVTYFTDNQIYSDDPVILRPEENGLQWMGSGPSAGQLEVSVFVPASPANSQYFCLAVLSKSGTTYGLVYSTIGDTGTYFGYDTGADAGTFCAVPPVGAGTWSNDVIVGWAN